MTDLKRRSFLGAILAAGAAPMIVKAGVLMPVRPLKLCILGNSLVIPAGALDGKSLIAEWRCERQRVVQVTDGPSGRRVSFEWNGEVWVPTCSFIFNV